MNRTTTSAPRNKSGESVWDFRRIYHLLREKAWLIALCTIAALVHRWFTFPYAYLDRTNFRRHRSKLTVFPGLLLATFLCLPLVTHLINETFQLSMPIVLGLMGSVAAAWNFWHTSMQRYGFLRMYNNKHWLSDVVAGAGIGIMSTKIAYWIYPVIKRKLFIDIAGKITNYKIFSSDEYIFPIYLSFKTTFPALPAF